MNETKQVDPVDRFAAGIAMSNQDGAPLIDGVRGQDDNLEFRIDTGFEPIRFIDTHGETLRDALLDRCADLVRAAMRYEDPTISIERIHVGVHIERLAVDPDRQDESPYFSLEITVTPPVGPWLEAEGIWWDRTIGNRQPVERIFLVYGDDPTVP
ncbi:hypothetical protein [Acidiphilium sp. C61]|uniref:hypothetical protein n=1 Tax=Acidiphilium sp. C61 TaxID=1671485 RepID=UPI00157B065C|nr:hypothetical protein [Acidiphilium sp. C61]